MDDRRNVQINSQCDMQHLKIPTQLAKRFFGILATIWITIEVKAVKDRPLDFDFVPVCRDRSDVLLLQ